MNIRKLISFTLAPLIVSVIFIGIPLLLIFLNNYFRFPVYSNIFFRIIGWILIIVGFSVVTYSTTLHIKTGRITPLPVIEQPKKFIVSGLYKYCRNPMYVAEIGIFIGLFFVLGYVLLLTFPIIAFIMIHIFITKVEEPELHKVFEEQYMKYTKTVPRWIPKI